MKRYLIPGICCILISLGCMGMYIYTNIYLPEQLEQAEAAAQELEAEIDNTETAESLVLEAPYESPIDWDALQGANPDIYGWIKIPGTDVDYPLLQNAEDPDYYLNHNEKGEESAWGAIYSEADYNPDPMEDYVTVLYGHRMADGSMFASLQTLYSSAESMAEHNTITVYLPTREIKYRVFMALPYDNRHILYQYDTTEAEGRNTLLLSLDSARALDKITDESVVVTDTDHLLILSTCLHGDGGRRYLVIAKEL